MFGFGKKKKENEEKSSNDLSEMEKNQTSTKTDDIIDVDQKSSTSKKTKKRFSTKLIFIILLVLIGAGASGYLVYSIYFTKNDITDPTAEYKKIDLEHINLPDEMVEFTFHHFRKLYISMVDFNNEINLLDKEIQRVEDIAKKYPDQGKIAEKEKKNWKKVKKTLEKTFINIEKPIKNMYVLFSVNREQGLLQITNKQDEFASLAQTALTSTHEKTLKLKEKEIIPQGFFKGNFYKIKKKFL